LSIWYRFIPANPTRATNAVSIIVYSFLEIFESARIFMGEFSLKIDSTIPYPADWLPLNADV
jgi:hypothetical protein